MEQGREQAASLGGKTDLVILAGVNHAYQENDAEEPMIRSVADCFIPPSELESLCSHMVGPAGFEPATKRL